MLRDVLNVYIELRCRAEIYQTQIFLFIYNIEQKSIQEQIGDNDLPTTLKQHPKYDKLNNKQKNGGYK